MESLEKVGIGFLVLFLFELVLNLLFYCFVNFLIVCELGEVFDFGFFC